MKNNLNTTYESFRKKPDSRNKQGYRRISQTDLYQQVVGFTCMHCKQLISSDPVLSGVNNRNHCPYCLASKHVDLIYSGDRMSACKSVMRPIGLSWKRTRNKYGSSLGELMIIHYCEGCGSLSINRIAADDDPDLIVNLFYATVELKSELRLLLDKARMLPLEKDQYLQMKACLYGKN
ncbi:MAG: RNHCP domain-containing protein [Anaerolineaceae bacterium]|nr:RNHCP domain-containing protein [Anaerolineaceae bacterium]